MAVKKTILDLAANPKRKKKAPPKGDREVDQYGNPRELDLSDLESVPDVPQVPLERYDPPRGRPSNLDALLTPDTARRLLGYAKAGEEVGGRAWYNAQPLRNEFVTELGPEEGPAGFDRFIDMIAATSPRSTVDTNIRRSSLLYQLDKQGRPISTISQDDLPTGYGHIAHKTHSQLLRDLEGGGHFSSLKRPKTSSFAEDLKGNQRPVTIDTHNMSAVTGDFDTKVSPSGTQYKYLEEFQAELADKLNMTPAQFQASVWMGGGTGVADARPFMEVFDDVLARTAERDKVSKREALTAFIRGDRPLWQMAGLTALAGGLAGAPEEAEAGPVTGILARTARDLLPDYDDQVKQYKRMKRSEPGFAKMELEFLTGKIEEMLNRGNTDGAREMAARIEALAETGSRVPTATRQQAARILGKQSPEPGPGIDPVARALEDEVRLIERDIADNPGELLADRGRLKRDQERLQGALESLRLQRGLPPAAAAGAGLLGAMDSEEAEAGPAANELLRLLRERAKAGPVQVGGESLPGAPNMPNIPGGGQMRVGQNLDAVRAAEEYARRTGMEYTPLENYVTVDPERGGRIARAYERMPHNPDDPRTAAAYKALADETLDQYESMLSAGVEPYFIRGKDPYAASPYLSLLDLAENKRLGVFPTDEGFGTDEAFDVTGNPLLAEAPFKIGGQPARVNDIFRAVHDFYGHAKPGVGFRAMGEENAYQSHAGMYSPQARPAAATETRGQNSWLNFGPHGETNRTAGIDDTVFADQKTGLLPNWAVNEGVETVKRPPVADALRPAVDERGMLDLTHYSRQPLELIDPARYGSGMSGRSIQERARAGGQDWVDRSYYGIDKGVERPYQREAGLGPVTNKAEIQADLLYDANQDPSGIWRKAGGSSSSEKAVRDAGFSGYWADDPKLGKVAVVFDPLEARRLKESGYAGPIMLAATAGVGAAGMAAQKAQATPGLMDRVAGAPALAAMGYQLLTDTAGGLLSRFVEIGAREFAGAVAGAVDDPARYGEITEGRSTELNPVAERIAGGVEGAIGSGLETALDYKGLVGPSGMDLLRLAAEGYDRVPEEYQEPLQRLLFGGMAASMLPLGPAGRAVRRTVGPRWEQALAESKRKREAAE